MRPFQGRQPTLAATPPEMHDAQIPAKRNSQAPLLLPIVPCGKSCTWLHYDRTGASATLPDSETQVSANSLPGRSLSL